MCKILLGWQGQLNLVDIKQKHQAEVQLYNLRKPRYPLSDIIDVPKSPKKTVEPANNVPRHELRSSTPVSPANPTPVEPVDPVDPVKPETGAQV